MPEPMTYELDSIPWERLASLLAGELSAAERETLLRWIQEDPERETAYATVEAMWRAGGVIAPRFDAELALMALRERSGTREGVRHLHAGRLATRPSRWNISRRAMVAAGLAAGLAGVAVIGGPAAWRHAARKADAVMTVASTERATGRGQRMLVRLTDGTEVLLGPDSRIRYLPEYGLRARIVSLEGRAYFSVQHDASRPFVVRTSYGEARDLGTQFVVEARRDDARMHVAVRAGEVALAALKNPGPRNDVLFDSAVRSGTLADAVILKPSDLGWVTRAGTTGASHGVPMDQYFSWTEGRLVYRAVPLRDIVAELERWYDVKIQLADSALGNRLLTATFRDEPVSRVIDLIGATLGLEVERRGNAFVLSSPRHVASRQSVAGRDSIVPSL